MNNSGLWAPHHCPPFWSRNNQSPSFPPSSPASAAPCAGASLPLILCVPPGLHSWRQAPAPAWTLGSQMPSPCRLRHRHSPPHPSQPAPGSNKTLPSSPPHPMWMYSHLSGCSLPCTAKNHCLSGTGQQRGRSPAAGIAASPSTMPRRCSYSPAKQLSVCCEAAALQQGKVHTCCAGVGYKLREEQVPAVREAQLSPVGPPPACVPAACGCVLCPLPSKSASCASAPSTRFWSAARDRRRQ